jgi:hypothetical protein
MNRNDIPLLRDVRVAAPCHESWDAMPGTERTRSCERCQHKVYNLSELTSTEAETLLRTSEGRLCVRFYRRADGTVLTKDCSVGVASRRQRRIAQAVAGVAAAVGSAAALLKPGTPEPTMGTPMALPVIQTTPAPELRPTMGMVAPEPVMGKVAMPEMGEVRALPSNH